MIQVHKKIFRFIYDSLRLGQKNLVENLHFITLRVSGSTIVFKFYRQQCPVSF